MSEIKKLTDIEHALLRPARYIGSVKPTKEERYVFEEGKFVKKEVSFVPGLIKIFEEILDNAVDIAIKEKFKKGNKIIITLEDSFFKIEDNGTGIPVSKNSDGEYYPFVAWYYLKAGSNFNDDNRISMGTHGEGSALTNYFSKKFIGESRDGKNYFKGVWEDNAHHYKQIVKKYPTEETGVTVTVYPDFERFEKTKFNEIDRKIIITRIHMLSMTYPEIIFTLNGERIKNKKIEMYI